MKAFSWLEVSTGFFLVAALGIFGACKPAKKQPAAVSLASSSGAAVPVPAAPPAPPKAAADAPEGSEPPGGADESPPPDDQPGLGVVLASRLNVRKGPAISKEPPSG